MRRRARAAAVIALAPGLILLPPQDARAQSVEESLSQLARENAELYVEPLTHGFGHAITSAFFEGGAPRGPLSFNVGIRLVGTLPPDASKTFTPVLPERITVPEAGTFQNPYVTPTTTTPTATGDGPGIVLELTPQARDAIAAEGGNPDDYNLRFPDGLDIPAIPFAVVEGNLGVGMGTEVSLRLIPSIEIIDDVGPISAFGAGVRHSITNWLAVPPPVDVAVSLGIQSFSAGDYIDAAGRSFGLAVSRSFGAFTVFAEGGLQSSSVDVEYELTNELLDGRGETIRFSSDLGASGRFAVGGAMQLAVLNVAGQFSAKDYNTVSLRVGVGTP